MLEKSKIVERDYFKRDIPKIEKQEYTAVELDKVEISKIERLRYNISKLSKNTKFKVELALKIFEIKRLIDMNKPILDQLKHKPLWLKIIGVIVMILAFFGVNTEVISPMIDQIAQVIVGIITIISGFMIEKSDEEKEVDKL